MRPEKLPPLLAILAMFLTASNEASADNCSATASQQQMNICADRSYRQADRGLQTINGQIIARLNDNAPKRKLFVEAENAWTLFRDRECAFATAASTEGSIYPMLVTRCRERLTLTRTKDLKKYAHCSEYDSSCPVPAR